MIVCPVESHVSVAAGAKEKFDEKFLVVKGRISAISSASTNGWSKSRFLLLSTWQSATDILPGLRQVHWDLVIVDEAHRCLGHRPRERRRVTLWESSQGYHGSFSPADGHSSQGDPVNFSLFLQLLDADAYADVRLSARR